MSDYVPDEVLVEIFLKLPAKSLSELRRVCKSWYSLINDPNFISRYTQFSIKNANTSQLILRHKDMADKLERFTLHCDDNDSFSQFKALDAPFADKRCPYLIIGICCGLVCLFGLLRSGAPNSIIIWNPSLESCVRLPVKPPEVHCEEPIYGFGFDPKSGDYKVVRIVYRGKRIITRFSPSRQIVDVFALKVGNWENITDKAVPPCIITDKSLQAFLNGAIHWIGRNEDPPHVTSHSLRRLILLVFDVNQEVFKELNIPYELKTERLSYERKEKFFVGVLDQTLVLMHYYIQWSNSPFFDGCCIWMMKEYGVAESWTKQFKIDLRLGLGKMVGLRKNGEILLVTRYNGELVSYDTVNRKIHKLGIYSDTWSFYLDTYIESLVFMNRVNGVFAMSATSSKMALGGRISGVETTDKGKGCREK